MFARYAFEDFEPWGSPKRKKQRTAAVDLAPADVGALTIAPDARAPVEKLKHLLGAHEKLRHTWAGQRPDFHDQSPSGYDQSLANLLWGAGWQEQEIVDAMIEWRREHGHDPKPRQDYYARTLETAKRSASVAEQRRAILSDVDLLSFDREDSVVRHDDDQGDEVDDPRPLEIEDRPSPRLDFKLDPLDKPQRLNTHRANAWRIAKRHGHELRHVPGLGFLVYDGRRWQSSGEEALRFAMRTSNYICEEAAQKSREAADTEDGSRAKALRNTAKLLLNWAQASEQGNAIQQSLKLTAPLVTLDATGLDSHDFLLNVENGTLDLRTGQLRPHDPRDLLTKLAPVKYDADAEARRWRSFINEIMDGRERLVRFLQKALGYSLIGLVNEQVLFFAFGTGQNGKTTLLEAMLEVLGSDYVAKAAPDLLMSSKFGGSRHSEIADLRGARIVICQEVADRKMFDSQRLKELTGERHLKARRLYGQWFGFRATFTIWLSANHRPQTRDNTPAFWRRIRLIPFTRKISRPDKALGGQLAAERSGILNWLLEGVQLYLEEGLEDLPPEVTEAVAEYRRESDHLGQFITDCCLTDEGLKEKAQVLRRGYEAYSAERGFPLISGRDFKIELIDRGFQRPPRTRTGFYYHGLALKPEFASVAGGDALPPEDVN